jgi:hypothetical protein
MPDKEHSSERVGAPPHDSEVFGNVPKHVESFGNLPNGAEHFRSLPKLSERKQSHTLTVREVARMFEAAGVARTERSIINWCQLNRQGVPRLDSYFDPNERRYFISPQSVELAIKEEQAKAVRVPEPAEAIGNVPKGSEHRQEGDEHSGSEEQGKLRELLREVTDLRITNKAKDMFIERLQEEREDFVNKLMISSHRVGELEGRLLQLEGSEKDSSSNAEVI